MGKNKYKLVASLTIIFIISLIIYGCGSGSQSTSGSLSLNAPKQQGQLTFNALATYTPASGSTMPGTAISYHWYVEQNGVKGAIVNDDDRVGVSTFTLSAVPTGTTFVCVYATFGGLTNSEGTLCTAYSAT